MQISKQATFVSQKGGSVIFTDPETGEVLLNVPVPPGRVPAREYLELAPDGAQVDVSVGLVAVEPRSLSARIVSDAVHDTSANPDYRPSPASAFERQIRGVVMGLQAKTDALEAELKAREAVAKLPRGEEAFRARPDVEPAPKADDLTE